MRLFFPIFWRSEAHAGMADSNGCKKNLCAQDDCGLKVASLLAKFES